MSKHRKLGGILTSWTRYSGNEDLELKIKVPVASNYVMNNLKIGDKMIVQKADEDEDDSDAIDSKSTRVMKKFAATIGVLKRTKSGEIKVVKYTKIFSENDPVESILNWANTIRKTGISPENDIPVFMPDLEFSHLM